MKITSGIFAISIFVTISASEIEEILCKARPGCHLAKCDPGFPSTHLNTNEYPIICTTTSVQCKESKAENEELKRQLQSLRKEWEEMRPIFDEMKRKAKETAENKEVNPIVSETKANATETAAEGECGRCGGLVHSGKCFTVPYISTTHDMGYDQAVAECVKHGALLAEIHDKAQQAALSDFALTKTSSGAYIWLGMEYKLSTSTLVYRSGMEKHSNQFQWDTTYPAFWPSSKYIAMTVGGVGDSDIGIWNSSKSHLLNGAMCEKDT